MLATVAILTVVLAVIYFQERNKEMRLQAEQVGHRLDLAEEILARDLSRVRANLLFVAELAEVKAANSEDADSLRATVDIFRAFVVNQKAYSQIRLIDRNGLEIVRVNWDGAQAFVTETGELQNKVDRYYVADSLSLCPGEIFTSEFDLNLENGQIERPLKPVVRFITPLLQSGQAGHLLVFNYQGSSLLQELSEISLPGRTYLIRGDGEFLMGPDPESEWGWLLGHTNSFQSEFGDLDLSGILEAESPKTYQQGIFQARRASLEESETTANGTSQPLFLVAHISDAVAFKTSTKLLHPLLLVGGIMLIPLALITRFWAASIDRREWQNKKIAASEKRLRELTTQLVSLQEEERRNLAREIHDSLGQQATAINLDLKLLKEKLRNQKEVDRVISESEELLRSLHGFASRVRPAELDELGLKEALESHIWEFESRTQIDCEFECAIETDSIDTNTATHIFRIVQESLNNIAKHANANIASVQLQLNQVKNELQLRVSDDGIGIENEVFSVNQDTANQKRLGMIGIRERVELLRGNLNLESSKGAGTLIEVVIPLANNIQNQLGK